MHSHLRPARGLQSLAACLCLAFPVIPLHAQDTLQNTAYTVALQPDASITVTGPGGASKIFRPDFTVLFRTTNPSYSSGSGQEVFNIIVPRWKTPANVDTSDAFQAAPATNISASSAAVTAGRVQWTFPAQAGFTFSARLELPETDGEPQVTYTLTPTTTGYYSVGYLGAPALAPSAVDVFWQPPAWNEKRFPANPVMATENISSMPFTALQQGGVTYGVVADPLSLPFRMPTLSNSQCGVVMRTTAGEARPMYFAPVLGAANSNRTANSAFTSRFRLTVRTGDIYESHRHLATKLYAVRDFRQNTLTSLNGTLENMIEYALDDVMARWNADLRGCDYSTDVANTVKVVSALHPMSIAMVTDREEIYRRRAVPMLEYMLSREKYLFTTNPAQTGQGASAKMLGPTGEVFEWSSLYHFSLERSGILRRSAYRRFNDPRALNLSVIPTDGKFTDALALYRATGNPVHLELAKSLGEQYLATRVNTPQVTWPSYSEFFTDPSPRWMQLFELWEETGDVRYRDAAIAGAKAYTQFCAVSPKIPDGDVTINMSIWKSGSATLPAWRVSQVGLTPEATNTHMGNPAIFLTQYAPYFLRTGALANDTFIRDQARNAVVGRYANYPGYKIGGEFSTVYEPATYATTPPAVNNRYNQFYFNHIWPQIAMLMDYLVSDTSVRSGGAVDFPSRYAQGYVYLQSKVYGDRPGKFHGDQNVRLYLPRGLATIGDVQLNYVAGRGNGNLYLAFTNQSASAVTTTVTLNPALAPASGPHPARVWQENQPAAPINVQDGQFQITVAPKGITSIAISGISPSAPFQEKMLDSLSPRAHDTSHLVTVHPQLKNINGMMLGFGRDLNSAYVWLDAPATTLSSAKLVYRTQGGTWQEMTDTSFPYEFSVPLADTDATFEYRIQGTMTTGGAIVTSTDQLLRRDGPDTPEDLAAVSKFGYARVSWTATPGASSYRVYRSTDGGSTYTLLPASVGLTDTVFFDTTAIANIDYFYRVSTLVGGDEGNPSIGVPLKASAGGELIVDNTDAGFTSLNSLGQPWAVSTNTAGYYGTDYTQDGTAGADTTAVFAKWTPTVPLTARYRVAMRWVAAASRPATVPVEINHANGTDSSLTVNQKLNNATWMTLGDYEFTAGNSSQSVKITGTGDGFTIADAVRFQLLAPAPVTSFSATPGNGAITLNWSPTFGATVYQIRRAPLGTENWTIITPADGTSGNSFLDATAAADATWRYVIQAGNDGGLSADSAVVTAGIATPYGAWRETHFGTNPGPESALLADPDADGLANLAEYALNLDPKASQTSGLPTVARHSDPSGGVLEITYRVDPSKTDVTCIPEYSEGLTTGSWHTIDNRAQTGTDGSIQIWKATTPPLTGKGFVRLKFTK